jgi:hypothetical protein
MLELRAPAGGDLERLTGIDGFQEYNYRIQQLAVWTICDNLGRNDDASCSGGGKITDEEVAELCSIFQAAGIQVADYRVLQEVVPI